MSTLVAPPPHPVSASFDRGFFTVSLEDGSTLHFPSSITLRLASATVAQLTDIELLPFTLRWEAVDEDISVDSLIERGFRVEVKSLP